MSALPELDDLDLPAVVEGDTPHFSPFRSAIYSPDAFLLSRTAGETTGEGYVAAWKAVAQFKADPVNWRRSPVFTRDSGHFFVFTEYLGLDMDLGFAAMTSHPHLPLIFETKVFTTSGDLPLWRYHTRAAAFAGHDQVVKILTEAPGMILIPGDFAFPLPNQAPA